MKTFAVWHSYPGSEPEPPEQSSFDPTIIMLILCVLAIIISTHASARNTASQMEHTKREIERLKRAQRH